MIASIQILPQGRSTNGAFPHMSPAAKSLSARVLKAAIVWWFNRQGWTVQGTAPIPRKFVVIAAPHTSNWDFFYFIGAADGLNLDLSFMAKKSLFRWPFARMMRDMGGIAVDRSKSSNAVDAMITEFGKRDEFMLTIAPEGTRSKAGEWKTGFYNIAVGAKVPMVCGMMDYAKRTVGLGPAIWPSGDYEADLAILAAYYSQCTPRHPHLGTPGMAAG
jgi:1-acyl-sn-glycerol-3-phosphate acyltransferase